MTKVSMAISEEKIVARIYLIREQKVMIDRDLAELYGVETRRLKEQVNRNINRFPMHYMFKLTKEESDFLRSQNATLKKGTHSKYLPYAFTEHGILMLANVLKSGRAIEMSIKIIDVFVRLREMLLSNKDMLLKLEQLEKKIMSHDESIHLIFEAVKQLLTPSESLLPRRKIGFRRSSEDD